MRTVNKVGGANGTIFTEFYGNTTDVKPTEDVPNGSAFYEIDNNMQEYRFDKENKIWYPITRGGTAPSDDYLPLSGGIMTGDINMNGNSLLNAKSITLKDETGEYTVALNLVHLETTNPETGEPFSYEAIEFSNSDDTSKQYVITGVADPLLDTDVVNLRYLGNNYIPLTGTKENKPVTGVVKFNGESTITGVSTPVNDTDVVTKKYADDIKTELDDKTNQLNEDTTALQKRQNVLVGSETGNLVSVDDAFSSPLCGLTIYGKSTQDGTPSPDAPVPIVSAGEDGSVTVKVTGRNILDMRNSKESVTNSGVTYTRNADYSFTRTGTATEVVGNVWIAGDYFVKPKADLSNVFCVLLKGVKYSIKDCVLLTVSPTGNALVARNENFVPTQDMYITGVRNEDFIKGETYNDIVYPAVYVGEKALQYEPYRGQLLTIPTPNGLPGIPVTSGGNYTDPQGQQWVCDEVDLERGVKVQRVGVYKFYSSDGFVMEQVALGLVRFHNTISDTLSADTGTLTSSALCSALPLGARGSTYTQINVFTIANTWLYINIENITSVNELQQYLQQTPMTLIALLATPIETPLTPAEIAAYKALTAYAPDTVVQASDGARVKLEYQRDVNIVIKKFEDAIASMTTT
jgi:hypothetical protein